MVKWDSQTIVTIVAVALLGAVSLYGFYRLFNMLEQPQSFKTPLYSMSAMPEHPNIPTNPELLEQLQPVETVDVDRPYGESDDRIVHATQKQTILESDEGGDLNWFNCSIYNAGPDNVYYTVNARYRAESPLLSGQSINVPFNKRDSIKKIYFNCDKGKTATVYVNALR